MRSKIRATGYNSRIPRMSLNLIHRAICLLFLFLGVATAALGQAANWEAPEQQLAAKISAITGPGAVSVEFSNRSSLTRSQAEEVHRGLLRELSILGLKVVDPESAVANIQIMLSENLHDQVWVGRILQGKNEPAVVLVSFPSNFASHPSHELEPITLRRTLLWSQKGRILDVAVLETNPQQIIVLDDATASLYQMQGGRWQIEQSLSIRHSHAWPRDLRGRLVLRKDHLFDAYLPGTFCQSTSGAPLGLTCRETEDPWPLGTADIALNAFFAPSRNFFTGALMPGVGKETSTQAFFSAAALPRDRYTLWLFAATNGELHMLDGFTDQVSRPEWGSDITSVHSGCGSGWQVLTTAKDAGVEAVRAFDIPDREPFAVGQPLEFEGAVTALWPQSDGGSAIAVLQNHVRGEYEAYQVSVACGR